VYCEQLLGIARRKAGTVVKCPNCSGQLIVPPPEADDLDDKTASAGEPEPDYAAEPKIQIATKGGSVRQQSVKVGAQDAAGTEGAFLFERSDFDELLKPSVEKKPGLAGHIATGQKGQPQTVRNVVDLAEIEGLPTVSSEEGPLPALHQPLIQPLVQAPGTMPAAKPKGIIISRMKATLFLIFMALALAGAFGGGVLFALKVLVKKTGG